MAIAVLMLPAASLAARITDFGDGRTEAEASPVPFPADTVNLTLPAECHVRKAALNITTARYDPPTTVCPESLRVWLNGSTLYEFDGPAYGAFGHQQYFTDGNDTFEAAFRGSGGERASSVRIPKGAAVENATFGLECAGGPKVVEYQNLSYFGSVSTVSGMDVACSGDLNGDGIDDLIIGDPGKGIANYAGRAIVIFGGSNLTDDGVLNLTLGAEQAELGSSVACAGDINGDGYDDVIAGAPGYSNWSCNSIGAAVVFLGGNPMDPYADLVIYGHHNYSALGYSVAGTGDLDGDGYADFLVGEHYNDSGGEARGAAYLFFGGKTLDAQPDLEFYGEEDFDYFGFSVAGAGDLNGDGWPDIAVGAIDAYSYKDDSGEVDVYFGGPGMDNRTDLRIYGHIVGEAFGYDVAAAGDVDRNGFDDLIVGSAYLHHAHVYSGGNPMDAEPDFNLNGEYNHFFERTSVTGGFDINRDGYDDLAVGAPLENGYNYNDGAVFVFFGGKTINATADVILTHPMSHEAFGMSVAGGRDINNDGLDELIVGAAWSGPWSNSGRVYIYSSLDGVLDPALNVSEETVYGRKGYVNTSVATPDLSDYFNNYIAGQDPSGWDEYGNFYCDVPVSLTARSEGSITLRLLNLTYSYSIALHDFTDPLNRYIVAHRREADGQGNIQVPLSVQSFTPGKVRFTDLDLTIDEAPGMVRGLPDCEMDEDSCRYDLLDLAAYFRDDFEDPEHLTYSVVSSSSPGIVAVTVRNGSWLAADALEGDQNDNWTGAVEVVVRAQDFWGSGRNSNTFRIVVRNVNDPPVITSEPPLSAAGGVEWVYQVQAFDGDGDRLVFSLAGPPEGMAINGSTGVITWVPQKWGRYPVAISVSDGPSAAWQRFVLAVPNRPPEITSEPVRQAFIGQPYSYQVQASDPDGEEITYTLGTGIEWLGIDRAGLIKGTPTVTGDNELRLAVSDGREATFQNFTLSVVWPNRSPFITSNPVTNATKGVPYVYDVKAYDSDRDPVTFALDTGPEWLSMDNASGRLSGRPLKAGVAAVVVSARDGRGGIGTQEFTLDVDYSVLPSVTISAPEGPVRGSIRLEGVVTRGTLDVARVEVRIDRGRWLNVAFNRTWNLTLDTTRLRTGEHTVEARAFDGLDYSPAARATLLVDNSEDIITDGTGWGSAWPVAVAIACALVVAAAVLRWRRAAGK